MNLHQDMAKILTLMRTVQYRLGEHARDAAQGFDDRYEDGGGGPDPDGCAFVIRDVTRACTLLDVAAEHLARLYDPPRAPSRQSTPVWGDDDHVETVPSPQR
jgi:hypothetical protein